MKSAAIWIAIFLSCIVLYVTFNQDSRQEELDLTRYAQLAESGKIQGKVVDDSGTLKGKYIDDEGVAKPFIARYMPGQSELVFEAARKGQVSYEAHPSSGLMQSILLNIGFVILLVVAWLFIMRQMGGGGNSKALSFGKSRAKLVSADDKKVVFGDVAGVDEAKMELAEVVEFLKDPEKFARLGARIPKGVLLYGAPGTGKTLLAKAVAGEAGVPFFSISGSDFVEMFVGVGASRVRDLFEQAKKNKPCVIFIDEIDAVGRHRWSGMGGGHDEREQTLNQLLVEMDGFSANEGVILIAATNRPDMLDKALLRPGRFDRQIAVDIPDLKGREQILQVHSREVKMATGVDLNVIAKGTAGFSGADLANLINEAALLTARRNKDAVTLSELEEARDRVMMGPERRSLVLTEKEKRLTAFHEAGHAVAARFLDVDEEVHKITIVPRGRALGVTSYLPSEERFTQFKNKIKERLVYAMGGRVAEELVFGDFTTGAGNDLMRITEIAKAMVCQFGMSDELGMRTFGGDEEAIAGPLGKLAGAHSHDYSDVTAREIDKEISKIVDEAHEHCYRILSEHMDALTRVAEALIERETLDGDDLTKLIAGEPLPPFDDEKVEAVLDKAADENAVPEDGLPESKSDETEAASDEVPPKDKPILGDPLV
ncbi:ATP-dependent zinc metalloprotease FtsH [Candidatus Sumerlaeota bacterium]|nr:ATP-dependent zinc metalloprotease FtsH [Candidatus Sumerlaeota bacterium]